MIIDQRVVERLKTPLTFPGNEVRNAKVCETHQLNYDVGLDDLWGFLKEYVGEENPPYRVSLDFDVHDEHLLVKVYRYAMVAPKKELVFPAKANPNAAQIRDVCIHGRLECECEESKQLNG